MTTSKSNQFDILLLIARPAAGKSEIIAHLKSVPIEERIKRYHIGEFEELDDFPMLWTWFEEDIILSQLGHQRLHTDNDLNFLYTHLWDVLIERINLEYSKKIRDEPAYHDRKTIIIEFARGTSHGGFSRAFKHLSEDIANQLAILYINVSWEESLRKNRARFNPDRPDSILEHGLSDEKLKNYIAMLIGMNSPATTLMLLTSRVCQFPMLYLKTKMMSPARVDRYWEIALRIHFPDYIKNTWNPDHKSGLEKKRSLSPWLIT